jgi:hypothetical protein
MLSPVKAITAGALIFAVGGVLLVAQPFDQQGGGVPGAATDTLDPCTAPITAVSGTIYWGATLDEEPSVVVDEVTHLRVVHTSKWDMDDDRLDGDQELHAEWDMDGTAGVNRGTVRIQNADGAWSGTVHGVGPSMGTWQQFVSLTGEGPYEGLSASLFGQSGSTGPLEGSIYPTDLASCDFASMQ